MVPGSRAALIAAAVLTVFGGPAMADDKPDCHGQNQEECRPDPQPDHGQDCEHSDDHPGPCPTTTTSSTTTTLLGLLPTTTTVVPTTTSTAAPTTTTTTVTPVVPPAPSAAVLGTSETLPRTGFPLTFYAAIGLLCLFLGVGVLCVRRLERSDRC